MLVVAHRAAHREAPENSLAAIARAIALGCDYVELDVRQTRDGVLVLSHGDRVDDRTDGAGAVAELSLAEVRALQLANGEPLPTFAEALALCRGRIGVYVDDKAAPPGAVVALLAAHDLLADAVVYGTQSLLADFKRLAPGLRVLAPHPAGVAALRRLVRELGPELVDGHARDWTVEEVRAAHALGVEVWVDALSEWDCEEGWRVAVALGVDAIQSDEPAALLALLERLGRR